MKHRLLTSSQWEYSGSWVDQTFFPQEHTNCVEGVNDTDEWSPPQSFCIKWILFFFLFSFWWVALPSTTTLGLWKIPAQWLFCLLLNVVLRLKITIHNNAKNGEGEQKKWRVCSQSPGFGGQHLKELGTMDPLASTTLTINIRTQEEHPNQVLLHTS